MEESNPAVASDSTSEFKTDSKKDQRLGATGTGTISSTNSTIKIQSLDDDEEDLELASGGGDGGGKSAAGVEGSNSRPAVRSSRVDYLQDKAPIPGNCCGFSTVSCCKFWAIFNLVQLFPCWMFVLTLHAIDFPSNKPGSLQLPQNDHLARCFEGGSYAAIGIKLGTQIILLLVYTGGSILFTIANFPPPKAFRLRALFTTIYYGTCFCFFLTFSIPFIFHLAVRDCYEMLSILVWALLVAELGICLILLYLSWKVIKLFRKYVDSTTSEDPTNEDRKLKKKYPSTPPTPQSSKEDVHKVTKKMGSMSSVKEQAANLARKVTTTVKTAK